MLKPDSLLKKIQEMPLRKKKWIVFGIVVVTITALSVLWVTIELPKTIREANQGTDKSFILPPESFKELASIGDTIKGEKDENAEQDESTKTRTFLPIEEKETPKLTSGQKEIQDNTQKIGQSIMKEGIAIGIASITKEEDSFRISVDIYNGTKASLDYNPVNAKLTFAEKDFYITNAEEVIDENMVPGKTMRYEVSFPGNIETSEIILTFLEIRIKDAKTDNCTFQL